MLPGNRATRPPADGLDQVTIAQATLADWPLIARWAADEGWNPGFADGPCFLAQDPEGFFLGRVDGEPVSAISVVNYDERFSFLGLYLVHPERRHRGHGIATWRAALPHAGTRTIGLDGVVAQQSNYARSGFALAYRNLRLVGQAPPIASPAPDVVGAAQVGAEGIAAYDRSCFPADRPGFLTRWVTAPGHVAYGRVVDGRLTGYGVIRPAPDFARIGPLFADTRQDAEALFDALCSGIGGGPVAIDVPEPNRAALAMAESRGLVPSSETARMYRGPVRPVSLDRVYGVTTLELG